MKLSTNWIALPALVLLASCGSSDVQPAASVSSLTAEERRVRAGQIRDAAAAVGMTQGWLLGGIADAETNMSQCWSELTWACQGPYSDDCGGPVVAGAGDGPCELMQGGLGMFQFDAGTFDDTLAREGPRILSIAGNVQAAVDFVTAMVIRSDHIAGVDTPEQAIAWMNDVRVGNDHWDPWIATVTHYYNGCAPEYDCWSSRYAHYHDATTGVLDEMGPDFWAVRTVPAEPPVSSVDGVRRHVGNEDILRAWRWDFSQVTTVGDDVLSAYVDGVPVPASPVLVMTADDPRVFLLDSGFKRHIQSEEVLSAWHFTFGDVQVRDAAELSAIPEGPPVVGYPWLMIGSGAAVYLVDVPLPAPSAEDGGVSEADAGVGGDAASSSEADGGARSGSSIQSGGCAIHSGRDGRVTALALCLALGLIVRRRRR